jgi:hypothetical protein
MRQINEEDAMPYVGGVYVEPTNEDRAGWAAVALDAFGAQVGQTGYDYSDDECLLEIAGDLLCDLFHLARQAGVIPEQLYTHALDQFEYELAEEADDDEPRRRYVTHNNDLGDWCPFSHVSAPVDADDEDRCPNGCLQSRVEDVED